MGSLSSLVVFVYSVNSGFPDLLSCPSSLFLDRYEECISSLEAQALEVGLWYNYSQVVAFVDHFDR